jgi:hypothetical protein
LREHYSANRPPAGGTLILGLYNHRGQEGGFNHECNSSRDDA